jgi:hypothetical protein
MDAVVESIQNDFCPDRFGCNVVSMLRTFQQTRKLITSILHCHGPCRIVPVLLLLFIRRLDQHLLFVGRFEHPQRGSLLFFSCSSIKHTRSCCSLPPNGWMGLEDHEEMAAHGSIGCFVCICPSTLDNKGRQYPSVLVTLRWYVVGTDVYVSRLNRRATIIHILLVADVRFGFAPQLQLCCFTHDPPSLTCTLSSLLTQLLGLNVHKL